MKLLQRVREGARDLHAIRERRRAERRPAPSRLVHVGHGQKVDPARCQDISEAGVRLSMECPLAVGESVAVHFTDEICLSGKVAWVYGFECGIGFSERLGGPLHQGIPVKDQARFRDGLCVTVILPGGDRRAILRWTKEQYASFLIREPVAATD